MVNSSVRSTRSWALGSYKNRKYRDEKKSYGEKWILVVCLPRLMHHCERYKALSSIRDYFALYK